MQHPAPTLARRSGIARRILATLAAPLAVALAFGSSAAGAPPSGAASPGLDPGKLAELDRVIEAAVERGQIPGAVLWLERGEHRHVRAYGRRMLEPAVEAMSEDTIFDVASLTKVIATAPAVLHLVDLGQLDLDKPVGGILPEFLEGGVRDEAADPSLAPEDRASVTVRQLLTHQSGLPPGIFLSEGDFWGHEEGVRRAATVGLLDKPGGRFRYSDVNYILLGEIVRRVTGQRLDEYCEAHLFGPLGMGDTGFVPWAGAAGRIAPTTAIKDYGLLRGVVHDPSARRMQGVAGHAGLFSTAADLALFLRVAMRALPPPDAERPILSPEILALATRNHLPEALEAERGLGWDIDSPFSSQRGEAYPPGGYGHTGWTGTSIWVDPASESFCILLTNRNHPKEEGSIKGLRIEVGTLAGEAVGYERRDEAGADASVSAAGEDRQEHRASSDPVATDTAPAAGQGAAAGGGPVLNGIDVLERDGFAALAGLRIGLVTNQTGVSRERRSTIDLLAQSPAVDLVALFSPEHGIRGVLDQEVIDDTVDASTGLPVYSLYRSQKRRPSPEQIEGLEALVFDIQDIGTRFYTYVSTMGLAMEAAAEAGIAFIVLDRVNPIGGTVVDGPLRTGTGNDFVAFHEIPVQHGMTAGELAGMFRAERGLELDLRVVPVEGWDPAAFFDETGLPWVNPSPNMRSLTQALLYPGVGLLEFTNVSVGRGTATPFEHLGAPWVHEGRLAAMLRDEGIEGLDFYPVRFTPSASVFAGEDCGGVRFVVTDRRAMRPLRLGIALMRSLHALHPGTYELEGKGNVLLRHEDTLARIRRGESVDEIVASWADDLEAFLQRREKFLLYPRD